jgi:hypothetical protein
LSSLITNLKGLMDKIKVTYKIVEGFDSYNNIPLWRVEGEDNEYTGEWHKVDFDAFAEWMKLTN